MSWPEFANFLRWLPPTPDSALFRAKHPNSWWWTPTHDFLAAVLVAVQSGNWQRGGGKGRQPEPVRRPTDNEGPAVQIPDELTPDVLAAAKQAMRDELQRRRKKGA